MHPWDTDPRSGIWDDPDDDYEDDDHEVGHDEAPAHATPPHAGALTPNR